MQYITFIKSCVVLKLCKPFFVLYPKEVILTKNKKETIRAFQKLTFFYFKDYFDGGYYLGRPFMSRWIFYFQPLIKQFYFIFLLGGNLICCESCPASFHAECAKVDPVPEKWYCMDCESGAKPLYGNIVWMKVGNYRWITKWFLRLPLSLNFLKLEKVR